LSNLNLNSELLKEKKSKVNSQHFSLAFCRNFQTILLSFFVERRLTPLDTDALCAFISFLFKQNNTMIGRGHVRTSLTGVTVGVDVSGAEKIWRTFQSLGDIAFAYSYSNVLIEIEVKKKTYKM
jgi:Transmembrane amino acid transporter protein